MMNYLIFMVIVVGFLFAALGVNLMAWTALSHGQQYHSWAIPTMYALVAVALGCMAASAVTARKSLFGRSPQSA